MIKKIKEIIIHKSPYRLIYNDLVQLPDGKKTEFLRISHQENKETIGVCVLPVLKNGDVILQDEYRYAVDKFVTSASMGLVDEGETKENAASRELQEEFKLKSNNLEYMGSVFGDVSLTNKKVNLFIANDCSIHKEGSKPEEAEFFGDVKIIKDDDLEKYLPQIEESLTFLIFQSYLFKRLKDKSPHY
jgi:ADP-ribose pyrophosphatase